MRRIPLWIRIGFLPVYGISLTIVLLLFQARVDLSALSSGFLTINIVLAMLIALAATLVLVLVPMLCWGYLPKIGRRVLAAIALRTLSQALRQHDQSVTCIGIGQREVSVVIRLETGFNSGVDYSTRFRVTNTAIIEAVEVNDASCICIVFDRINRDFWDDLEQRMNRDAAPPLGVTFKRELPVECLEFVAQLLNNWGGR